MAKVLVGCLVVLAVLAVGGGTAAYFLLIKPAASFIGDAARFASEIESYNERVQHTQPYAPPPGGQMRPDQLRRLLAAQGDMRADLEGRLEQLRRKYEELERTIESEGRDLNVRELFGAYRDIADVLLTSKRSQVEALNRHGFSLQEYAWVRQQAYTALGQQVSVITLDAVGAPRSAHPVSDEVLAMVEPHREQLMDMYVLAWFGL